MVIVSRSRKATPKRVLRKTITSTSTIITKVRSKRERTQSLLRVKSPIPKQTAPIALWIEPMFAVCKTIWRIIQMEKVAKILPVVSSKLSSFPMRTWIGSESRVKFWGITSKLRDNSMKIPLQLTIKIDLFVCRNLISKRETSDRHAKNYKLVSMTEKRQVIRFLRNTLTISMWLSNRDVFWMTRVNLHC